MLPWPYYPSNANTPRDRHIPDNISALGGLITQLIAKWTPIAQFGHPLGDSVALRVW